MFTLKSLPFSPEALEPYISARTLEFHYGKHHQAYVDNLNKLVADTDLASLSLEDLIKKVANQPAQAAIFNNAAQVYNHDFFWASLRPAKQAMPMSTALVALIKRDFGSLEQLLVEAKEAVLSQFGSGWVWLVLDNDRLKIVKTANADTVLGRGLKPLLVLDVWEHAYYLDYQNRRGDFALAVFANLLNWEFAAHNAGL